MDIKDVSIEVRDKTLARQGVILSRDVDFTAAPVFNDVGKWTLIIGLEHPMATVLRTPGSGIIVYTPTDVLFSGPVTGTSVVQSADDPKGSLTVNGVTDTVVLADRLAFPQPSNANATTQNVAHDARTGTPEALMHAYVNANVGPGAPTARKNPNLTMGTDGNHGTSTKFSARFQNLVVLLQGLAVVANLGFHVKQRGDGLVFETYVVTDRTDEIRLSARNGTLASQELDITAPTTTQAIVAGSGEEVDRAFYVGTNTDSAAAEVAWGRRIETFIDQRQSDDPTEYAQAANEELADNGRTIVSAALIPIDGPTMNYGADWNLGDRVAVITDAGEFDAPVTSAPMTINADGLQIGVTLGDPTLTNAADDLDRLAKNLASAFKRISSLETAT